MENIITKCCSKCGAEKELEKFSKSKLGKYGRKSYCKQCISDIQKTPEYKEQVKKYIDNNRESINKNQNERYHNNKKLKGCKPKIERTKEEQLAIYRELNKKKYEKDPEKFRERSKQNRKKFGSNNEYKKKWYNDRMRNDPLFKSWENFATLYRTRHKKNGRPLEEVVGYSKETFNLKVGVGQNGYDLDHKIPVTWFNDYEPHLVYHYDNLQWIPANENRSKLNRFSHPISLEYFEKIKHLIKDEYISRFKINSDIVFDIKNVYQVSL